MNEQKRISRESFIYVVGEGLSKSLAFVLLPLYTRYLSVEEVGVLLLVAGIWPVIVILMGQTFSAYLVRGYYEYEERERFLGTTLMTSVVLGLMIAFLIHLTGPWTFKLIFSKLDYEPYLKYAVFFAVFRLYLTHVLSVFRARRQPVISVTLSFIYLLLNLIAVLITIFILDAGLLGILKAQLLAYAAAAVIYTIKLIPQIKFKPLYAVIRPGINFVLPLVPHALSGWVISYVGRIIIERDMTLADVSLYSVASQIALILSVINNGLNQAWIPFVYANYEKPDFSSLFALAAKRNLLLVLLVMTALSLFSRELLLIMGKQEYLSGLLLVPFLAVPYLFHIVYLTYAAIIVYQKRTRLMPVISITSGALAVPLNIALVPEFGVMGAALSTNLAFALMAVLAICFTRRYLKANIFEARIVYFVGFLTVMLGIHFAFVSEMPILTQAVIKLFLCATVTFVLIRMRLLNLSNIRSLLGPG